MKEGGNETEGDLNERKQEKASIKESWIHERKRGREEKRAPTE